jgi:putative FmdB family regulatory protein
MPVFEYECKDCGKKTEFLEKSMKTINNYKCPECGSENMKKLISGFSLGNSDLLSADGDCPTGNCQFS